MNNKFLIAYVLQAVVVAASAALWIRSDYKNARGTRRRSPDAPTYTPTPYYYAPWLIVCVLLIGMMLSGAPLRYARAFLGLYAAPFILYSIYYSFLLLVIPLLRRRIDPNACAALWMIPFWGIYYILRAKNALDGPLLVLKLPFRVPHSMGLLLTLIWLAGFCIVMLWQIGSHICYRRFVLENARVIKDARFERIWYKELLIANPREWPFRTMTSPQVNTPLSIGLFHRTTCVILPEKEYSDEELSMILRHELVHICRRDSQVKLSLMICMALQWFNPLMWMAIRRSAEDLELSCDEIVLYGKDSEERKNYGMLLLNTAADGRGFTTCLSASVSGLRYRLKNVINCKKRSSGALLCGILVLLVLCSTLVMDIGVGSGTVGEMLRQSDGFYCTSVEIVSGEIDSMEISSIEDQVNSDLSAYIMQLQVTELLYDYEPTMAGNWLRLKTESQGQLVSITVNDHVLQITFFSDDSPSVRTYYLQERFDWNEFVSLVKNPVS